MSVTARLTAFAVALAAAFGVGAGIGSAFGPFDGDDPARERPAITAPAADGARDGGH